MGDDEVLFTVDGTPVSREEFQYVFNKNSVNDESTDLKAELDEYLELYINFKLKVMEAEALGYPERQSFQNEFGQYRDQLAQSYMTDNQASEKLMQEAYQRLKEEVNASHILIRVDETAPPADTLAAYQRMMDIRKQVVEEGKDFEALARERSEDPSAAQNGGNLGYFSALQMVYPFENAAFKTPIGGVSMPIRTRFGYHLVKVNDRRPSAGKVQVSHIMIRATEGMPEADMEAAEAKIRDIYRRLQNGENWFELARQFSEDVRTKSRGGMLPWFGSGEMVVEFEEAAFGLDTLGQFSEPVQTAYGWHIIRLEDRQGLKPYVEMERELQERIGRDSRSQITQQAFMDRLMRENQLQVNTDVLEQALLTADSTLLMGTWVIPNQPNLLSQTLMTLGGGTQVVEVGDFFQHVFAKQARSRYQVPRQYMMELYQQYREDAVLVYEREHLAEKYEDYRYLVKEYRDGILLFQLMDDQIWSKAVADTAGLKAYFNSHQDQYRWDERAAALILNATSAEVLAEAKGYADAKQYPTGVSQAAMTFSGPIREVNNDQRKVLNQALTLVVNDPTTSVSFTVVGASRDSAGYRSLVNYLTERGVAAGRITTQYTTGTTESIKMSVMSTRAKAMESYFNQAEALTLVVKEGLFERSQEPVLNEVPWKKGYHPVRWDNRYFGVYINDLVPGAAKQLNEVRGAVISDYQDHLEKEWIAALRKKYPVRVNEEALQAVYEAYDLK